MRLDDILTRHGIGVAEKKPDDTTGSPGPKMLIAGNRKAGFFGEVPEYAFISGEELSNLGGLIPGIFRFSGEPWLKFMLDGKILFKRKKPIKSYISWDEINDADLVFGDKIISFKGVSYKLRLIKGLEEGVDTSDGFTYAFTKNSEWNRLMFPIHESALNQDFMRPEIIPDNFLDWGVYYSDEEQNFISDPIVAHRQWCQETVESTGYKVIRGGSQMEILLSRASTAKFTNDSWSPVLEVVEEIE